MKHANLPAVIVFSILFCAASALAVVFYMNTREAESVAISSATQTSGTAVLDTSQGTEKAEQSTQPVSAAPTTQATSNHSSATTGTVQAVFPADINRISKEELLQISGIGEGKAAAILAYRANAGKFTALEQLLEVDGIGQKTYEMLCGYLYIRDADMVTVTTSKQQTGRQTSQSVKTKQSTTKEETATKKVTTVPPTTTVRQRHRVNISTATALELADALLISPELADSIVQLRTDIQYFSNIHELLHAEGMTVAQFNEIKEYVYVE